jgi:hypothetical protein
MMTAFVKNYNYGDEAMNIDKFLLLKPFLKIVSGGKFFVSAFTLLFRILAVLCIVGAVYFSANLWMNVSSAMPAKQIIMMFLMQIFILALFYAVMNIFFVRADSIQKVSQSNDYAVVPVAVVIIKSFGEIVAASMTLLGVFSALSIWLVDSARGLNMIMPLPSIFAPVYGGSGVAGGFITLIAAPIAALIYLAIFYCIAELVGALADIAKNTSKK